VFKKFLPLVAIVIFGLFIRLIYISQFPPSLNWDEVSIGYNAYSLLKTGADEWGTTFPTIFRAFGDYKLPGYVYAAVFTEKIFGINPLGTRLPSILAGTLLIIVTYLITRKFVPDAKIAVLAALLVALEPWSLFLSRIAVEANLAALFIALGVLLLLSKKPSLGILFLCLSAWTYNSARIFVPAFLFVSVIIFQKKYFSPKSILVGAILLIPMFFQLFSSVGLARFGWMNILDSGAIARIEAARAISKNVLLDNRYAYFAINYIYNYINHFSPQFLFIKGGTNYQFNIPNVGLLSWVNLPFFYLGLIIIIISKRPQDRLLAIWILLAPLAGSATRDAPHTLRAITMLPAVFPTIALGYFWIHRRFSKLLIPLVLTLFVFFINYVLVIVPQYRTDYSWSWQTGYSQLVVLVRQNYQNYDQIIITKRWAEPHEFFLFYWPWDPQQFKTDPNLNRYFRSNWYWVDNFAKFRFVNDWEMPQVVKSLPKNLKYLIVSSPDNPSPGSEISQIKFLDGKTAFYIKSL
jgi:4-amino-4-deoxy-L-arabinose transferase-like glycosyltransferase